MLQYFFYYMQMSTFTLKKNTIKMEFISIVYSSTLNNYWNVHMKCKLFKSAFIKTWNNHIGPTFKATAEFKNYINLGTHSLTVQVQIETLIFNKRNVWRKKNLVQLCNSGMTKIIIKKKCFTQLWMAIFSVLKNKSNLELSAVPMNNY